MQLMKSWIEPGKTLLARHMRNRSNLFSIQITKAHNARTVSRSEQKLRLENHKRYLREALAVSRQLEKEAAKVISDDEHARTQRYATSAQSLLRDFSSEMAKRKVADLENEFIYSFHRLARKEDVDLHAAIDSDDI